MSGLGVALCAIACANHASGFSFAPQGVRHPAAIAAPWSGRTSTRLFSSKSPEPAKKDKRGFPIGDPRTKGGDENDIGLQVGPPMWKWPSQWPYPEEFFTTAEDSNTTEARRAYFDSNIQVSKTSVISPEGKQVLYDHYRRHFPENAVVLDIGAGGETLLPEDVAVQSVVGIGITDQDMKGNSRLDEYKVIDLNDEDVQLPFEDQSFDAVVFTFSVEYLKNPRALFREVHRVLKERGLCTVVFTSSDGYEGTQGLQMKYWGDYTDAQKMYVVGSFFQFSHGGWSTLKGYELADDGKDQGLFNFGGEKKQPIFVVSCVKAPFPSDGPPLATMQAQLWDSEQMLPDERRLCIERIYSLMGEAFEEKEIDRIMGSVGQLENIYGVLAPMKKVLPLPIMAMLAANLAPTWTNSEIQRDALKEGLGLNTPQETFWKPLGELTSRLTAEDKIWLLIDVVPLFADSSNDELLASFPPVIEKVVEIVKSKLSDLFDGDVQLLAVDLAVTEYLLVKNEEERSKFLPWLEELAPFQLRDMLEERKNFKAEKKED